MPRVTFVSPFNFGGRLENPVDFIGRHRERATLLERSYRGHSTSLVGERRIGKTWLMDYLRLVAPEELGSRHRVIYVDASQNTCRTVAGFVAVCLRELRETESKKSPTLPSHKPPVASSASTNSSKFEETLRGDFLKRQELITLLLACPSIANRASRDNLLGGVHNGRLTANFNRNAVDLIDLENIFTTLLAYSGALEELLSFIQLKDFGTQAWQDLETFQSLLLVDSFPFDSRLGLNALEEAVRELKAKNQVAVLCLDEFERFGHLSRAEFDLNFFEGLRAIAGMGAAIVTASKTPLMPLVSQIGSTSPFFNIFEKVSVKPFTPKESKTFVESKISTASLNELEQAKILELGQKWPLRLQLVGSMLYLDKSLALSKNDPDLYRPTDPDYWQEFTERLEDKYGSMVLP
ncbi:MAG: hypothetical protein HXX20_24740 [Chloroflexi bacterium]|nr:hypothetical protein [Chloroflexota bacterium]